VIRGLAIVALLSAGAPLVQFHNIARRAGLTACFPNGGDKSKEFIVETTGSGAAFLWTTIMMGCSISS